VADSLPSNSFKRQLLFLSLVLSMILSGFTKVQARSNSKTIDFHSSASLGQLVSGRLNEAGDFFQTGIVGDACGKVTVPANVLLKLKANFYAAAHLPLLANLQDPNLIALDLSNEGHGFELNDEQSQVLGKLSNLLFLDIQMCEVGSKTMKAICGLKRLRFLDISDSNFTASDAAGLRELTQLRHLAVNHNKLNDDCFVFLESMPQLTILESMHCGLTANGIHHMKNLRKLRCLKLSNNHLGDAALKKLPEMPELEEVALNECGLTSRAIPPLMRFPKLNVLYLDGIIADRETLNNLTLLRMIYALSIGGHTPPVKLEDLAVLRRCINLRRLSVTISPKDVYKLNKLLPLVKVTPSSGPRVQPEVFESAH